MQARHSEARAEADYLVNQKAFADTEAILARLSAQDAQMLEIARLNHTILEGLGRDAGSTDVARETGTGEDGPTEVGGGGPTEAGGVRPTA